ncbi:MAG: sulfurtransferase-like selenium metabolism protein YedF [Bacilli bacterium]|jgi:selenium metabolism protein YedF
MKTINATGLACPTPVIMAKKEIQQNPGESVTVTVDNDVARQNLEKLAASMHMDAASSGQEPLIEVVISPAEGQDQSTAASQTVQVQCTPLPDAGDWVVFFGKDIVGEGDRELGTNLVRMFFYTLEENDDLPTSILFMNAGVKLATLDEQVIGHLKKLEERGVEILVCGTCLNYYNLTEKLQIGQISNMYEIASRIFNASKEVTM